VASRLHPVAGRFELGLHVGVNLVSHLTDTWALGLSVAYNPAEWWALELRLGTALTRNNSVARDVAVRLSQVSDLTVTELKDTWRLGPYALAGFRFQPLYGKLNLASELVVHFQVFGWAGGGAALLDRTSPSLCLNPADPGRCVQGGEVNWDGYFSEHKASPLVSVALGIRFFLGQHHLLSLEARLWSYLDSFYQGVVRADVSVAAPTAGGTAVSDPGLTHVGPLELGYGLVF
jgi:outer membrane beta-barrel protein